ncbi:MAG: hypothetical protein J0H74_26340 [Chitinophagaceae bacterium]|nr:hypothetical protein [Chitinophagaceae bacterium]
MIIENGQEGNPFSFYYLDICCRQVEQKSSSRPIKEWTNADYLRLSNDLLQQTGVAISPNTLKRIFGKLKTSSRYYPQKATRDALAVYIGYKDWEDFTAAQPPVHTPQQTEVFPRTPEKRRTVPGKKIMVIAALVLLGVMIYIIYRTNHNGNPDSAIGKVRLTGRGAIAEHAPLSTIFQLQLPDKFDLPADGFTLSFGDHRSDKKIRPGELITHYYETPGRYYAVLNYEGRPVDTVPIYVKTSGWTATANMPADTTRVYPIDDQIVTKNNTLSVNPVTLQRSGIDTGHTFFVNFTNTRPSSVSADNFELAVKVRTSLKRPGVRCSQVNITVFGDRTMHTFAIMNMGCEAFTKAQFADWQADGASTDLSALSADLTAGGRLYLKVENKKVTVLLNQKKLFETAYQISAGNIYGVNVMFSGVGEIYNIDLRDLKNGGSLTLFPGE